MNLWLGFALIILAFVIGVVAGLTSCPKRSEMPDPAPSGDARARGDLQPGERFTMEVTRTELALAVAEHKIRHSTIARSSVGRFRLELLHSTLEGWTHTHYLTLEGKKR